MTDLVDRLNGPTSELRRLRQIAPILSSRHLESHKSLEGLECSECKEWGREVSLNMAKLKLLSENLNGPYSDDETASVIASVAPFCSGDGEYINPDTQKLLDG